MPLVWTIKGLSLKVTFVLSGFRGVIDHSLISRMAQRAEIWDWCCGFPLTNFEGLGFTGRRGINLRNRLEHSLTEYGAPLNFLVKRTWARQQAIGALRALVLRDWAM